MLSSNQTLIFTWEYIIVNCLQFLNYFSVNFTITQTVVRKHLLKYVFVLWCILKAFCVFYSLNSSVVNFLIKFTAAPPALAVDLI